MQNASFVTATTSIAASVCALFLVAACHSAPPTNGFVDTDADRAAEARLGAVESMPHMAFFDEQFYAPPPDEGAPVAR